ncbi:MAG TPA: hypothetical protein VMT30_02550 [Candidatus Saccharimonadia bacterium]|nr:hypothetical protein [Candidatus Saccharimonadia bacterium]
MDDTDNTAREIALDYIADNLVDALAASTAGATTATAHHIGQAAADIIELSAIVHGH